MQIIKLTQDNTKKIKSGEVVHQKVNGLDYEMFIENGQVKVDAVAPFTKIILQGVDKAQLILTTLESKELMETKQTTHTIGGNTYNVYLTEYGNIIAHPQIDTIIVVDTKGKQL
jgi:hypothetical protein